MAFRLLRLRAGGAVYSAKVTQTKSFAKDKFSETQGGRKNEVSSE